MYGSDGSEAAGNGPICHSWGMRARGYGDILATLRLTLAGKNDGCNFQGMSMGARELGSVLGIAGNMAHGCIRSPTRLGTAEAIAITFYHQSIARRAHYICNMMASSISMAKVDIYSSIILSCIIIYCQPRMSSD